MVKKYSKFVLMVAIAGLIWAFFYFNLGDYLTLQALKDRREMFQEFYNSHTTQMIVIYMTIYIVTTALSLPGATILTLAGGAIFGLGTGLILVSFASTVGATLAFLCSRFLLRESVQRRFGSQLKSFNEGMKKDGAFYLFSLRLIPVVPFFVINLVMGLTPISTWKFFFVSQVGMLAGTAVYVNAGTEIAKIDSLSGILSPALLGSFILLGIFPLIAKALVNFFKARRVYARFQKPKNYEYNLLVIGAGAAGLVSSYIAAAVKAKVGLIEKNKMGGDCLNTGCVPSKALIQSAKVMSHVKRAKEFGFISGELQMNFADVMQRVKRVIKKIEPHDSVERYTKLGVDCIRGTATIKSPWEVEVDGKILTTKNIIVAAGAEPLVIPFPGIDQVPYYTSDNIWELTDQPKRLLVLGGGPIGCELAQAFCRLGSQVTIVEQIDKILVREDEDIASFVIESFARDGVQVLTQHKAKEFKKVGGSNYLVCETNGVTTEIEFDVCLFALGRKARVTGYGLENLGIELNQRKTIDVDEYLRTNIPNIFVCGDVAGPYQFTHTAAHQAWFCAVNALFGPFKRFKVDYRIIPWCTFTDPEVARVGLNELEAKEAGVEYEVTTYGLDDLDRAIADEEDHGMVKVLTVPGKDKILGATIVGAHAGELITEFVAAMKGNYGLNRILGTIHIYPTWSEANKYLAGNWKNNHKPEKLLGYVAKFHKWRRG